MNEDQEKRDTQQPRANGGDHHDILEGTGFGEHDGRVTDPRQLIWFSPPRPRGRRDG
jgi:hypothetical protein